MHKLAQTALTYIRKHDLLRAGDRLGIAVSGGADSVALLRLMLELWQEIGLVLSIVHLNHQLRGAHSDGDEAFIRELAQKHGLALISERRDVKTYAAQKKVGIEAAARELRYELFERLLGIGTRDRIATAHTLDDQAETLLLKLARGAGTRGLAGIYPKLAVSSQLSALSKPGTKRPGGMAIVRPLLATRREDLRRYLTEIGQTWREDSSNRDLRHTRNRIRHGILPRFERHVNPSVQNALADTAEIARGEEEYWAEKVARLLPQVWQSKGTLNYAQLETLPLALRRRLVRVAAESLGLAMEFRHIEEVLTLKPESGASLPQGWLATRNGDVIRFHELDEKVSDYQYVLSVPGKAAVPESRLNVEAVLVNSSADSEDLLESSFAQRELVVRNWRPGERFWPAHTKELKKIKELLQDRHITGEEKRGWPVIASGDEVVWMRGFGVRRDFRAKNGGGVLIREFPINGE
ncbi:MAG: tRNA lysidine(34) synthetase TilS [Acidobacteria bacterium]|nr:MAG: tRNA lysidine(34) synthetase TilS [Acidobacteriota bacterium]